MTIRHYKGTTFTLNDFSIRAIGAGCWTATAMIDGQYCRVDFPKKPNKTNAAKELADLASRRRGE